MKFYKILLLLFITVNVFAFNNINTINIEKKISMQECSSIDKFSKKQIENIISSYIWGLPFDLEYFLPAIAWQESCAGLYKINMFDPSAGLYHAYLPSVMARHKELKNTKFNKNKIAQMLINDNRFAVSEAISELLFWKNYYKDNHKWNKNKINNLMIMSYNRGIRWHRSKKDKISAEKYLKAIKWKMKKIYQFINKNNINQKIEKIYIKK